MDSQWQSVLGVRYEKDLYNIMIYKTKSIENLCND